MGIKVVRFMDGTYGVRRRKFMEGYQFLDMTCIGTAKYHWWQRPTYVEKYAKAPTELIAIAKLESWKESKSKVKDIGTPV